MARKQDKERAGAKALEATRSVMLGMAAATSATFKYAMPTLPDLVDEIIETGLALDRSTTVR